MVTSVFYKQNGDTYAIKCSGHATGSEKVCAAVSGIVYSLAGYLLNSENITVEKSLMESGEAEFVFAGGKEAQTVYEMTVIGLMQLAKSFPNFVEIKEF